MSLKEQNTKSLFAVLLVNWICFLTVIQSDGILNANFSILLEDWQSSLKGILAIALVSVVNSLVSANMKARIVFWRWNNPLPGSEAFTRYSKEDPRVDTNNLESSFGPLPEAPEEQNKLWYKLYKTVGDADSVRQAHKLYLFTRDYATVSLLILIILGGAALIFATNAIALIYILILLTQYLIVAHTARNNGKAFVTNVLALKSANL
jgi:hypothetical protein